MTHETGDREFYVMPSFPTLTVSNLEGSLAWYRDALGFDVIFQVPGPNGQPLFSHLRRARYADLMLVQEMPEAPVPNPKGMGVMLTFAVQHGSIDALAEQARAAGVQNLIGPLDRPWNAREFTIQDPDGYHLTFTQQQEGSLTLDEIMNGVTASSRLGAHEASADAAREAEQTDGD